MMALKIRKILSVYLDYLICFYSFYVLGKILMPYILNLPEIIQNLFSLLFGLLAILVFIYRDLIFRGRSLGKRFFSLYIYNALEKKLADESILKKRGKIEFFTFPFDFIVIIVKNKQITDYICKTDVRDCKEIEDII